MTNNLDVKDIMTRSRIQMYQKSPFFAYLVLNLNFKEFTKEEKKAWGENSTMAVDNFGNLYYNPDWIKGLTENQVNGVLVHETLHLAFQHLIREKNREHSVWNIAIDLNVNDILINNGFELPKGLIPQNHEITLEGTKITIKDIDKKSAEFIYDEIYSKIPKQKIKELSQGGFDEHRTSDTKGNGQGKDGKKLSPQQIKTIKGNAERWKRLLVEASTIARQRGQLPAGMERHIDCLLNEKINWKHSLYKYITNSLPTDYSYNRPSRRSQATGIYMPYMRKEELNIIVSVDTSGSIQQQELTEFMTEIVNLSKSFSNLKMYVIICDAEVQDTLEVANGNIQELLDLKIKGGGGTSIKPIIKHIDNNYNNSKIWLHFSDGYTDVVDVTEKQYNTIWIVCKGGTNETLEKCGGEIINLN